MQRQVVPDRVLREGKRLERDKYRGEVQWNAGRDELQYQNWPWGRQLDLWVQLIVLIAAVQLYKHEKGRLHSFTGPHQLKASVAIIKARQKLHLHF